MIEYDTGDVILLQLEGGRDRAQDHVVPPDVAIPGISAALEVSEERIAERVALLSALDELKSEGLIEERQMEVRGLEGERNVYFPTEAGRERAAQLREQLLEETVVVRDGTDREVQLDEVDRYLPDPALPRALSRLTDDGVLYLDEEVGERFVDRTEELGHLRDVLAEVEDRQARTVLVGGEAGVGKTTLVTDELAATAREDGVRVAVGRCQVETTEPYAPIRNAVGGVIEGPNPFVRETPEPSDAAELAAERTAMFEDVVDAVGRAAGANPLMVVIDDLHTASEPTLSLFEHLAEHLSGAVLLVGTYRPEDLPTDHAIADLVEAWPAVEDAGSAPCRHLPLEPFGRDEVRQLVEWLVGRRGVPATFVDLLYERTGGNPLFVKESVTRLLQDGAVDPDYDIYPTDPDAVPLPEQVEDTIDIRLSVLDEETREILDIGGLIGQSVPFEALAAAADVPEPELREHVDLLVDSHVWERSEGDDGRLRFASGLMRETVVERIPDDRRRELHARIAEAVAAAHGDDPDYQATIARHYRQAGDPEEAFEFYLRAADHAKEVYAHEVALDNYDRALELAREELDRPEDDEDVLAVLSELAETYYLLGEYEEADRYYRYVADRTDDPGRGRRIAHVRVDMLDSQGRYEEALDVSEAALEEYGVADTRESCHLLGLTGGVHLHMKQYDAAEEVFERMRTIAERIDDPDAVASAYLDLGALDVARRAIDDDTIEMLERAVDVAEDAEDDRTLARALNNLAMAYVRLERLDAAEETYQRCLEVHERMGDQVQIATARGALGMIYREQGAFDRAFEYFEDALETSRRIDNGRALAVNHSWVANTHQMLGDLDAALEHAERAHEVTADIGEPGAEAERAANLGDVALDAGEFDLAAEYGELTLDLAGRVDSPLYRWHGETVLGGVARARGEAEAAVEHFRRALSAAEDVENQSNDRLLARAHARLARALLDQGEPAAGLDHAETGLEKALDEDDPEVVAAARVHLGAVLWARGDRERAEDELTTALERSRDPTSRMAPTETRALLELARLDRDRGDPETARERAAAALELVTDGGVGRYESAARDLLDELDG